MVAEISSGVTTERVLEQSGPPGMIQLIGIGRSAERGPLTLTDPGPVVSINNSFAVYGYKPDMIIAMDDLRRDVSTHPEYVERIVSAGVPVITTAHYDEWSMTEPYPLAEVIDFFGWDVNTAQHVLTNTCNYALAWAISRGRQDINLMGYDWFEPDSPVDIAEARDQVRDGDPAWIQFYRDPLIRRPVEPGSEGCCYLLGQAEAHGVRVYIPSDSSLMDMDRPGFFYGYSEQPEIGE